MTSAANDGERASWWFPFDVTPDTRQDFHILVRDNVTRDGVVTHPTEASDFSVQILRNNEARGRCIVRLLPPMENSPQHSLIHSWLSGWCEANPDGLTVDARELAVRGASVLRGPWRVGDRFTMGGFALAGIFPIGYSQVLGFQHLQVASIANEQVDLKFDFWLGAKGPEIRGEGSIAFVKDREGMRTVTAKWVRTDPQERREVELTVTRTKSESTSARSGSSAPGK